MIRRAFIMRLKPEALGEYRRHHENIWPELLAEIDRTGICSITTFQNGLEVLVVSQIADEAAWERLWNSDVHRRWAQLMTPLVEVGDDGAIEAAELTEMFHIAPDNLHAASGVAAASAVGAPGEALRNVAGEGLAPETTSAWTPPVAHAAVDMAVEAALDLTADPPAARSSDSRPPVAPAEMSPPPVAEPRQNTPLRRVRKAAIQKPAGRKKAPGRKKVNRKTAQRAKARANTKASKKPGKKKAAKTAPAAKVSAKKARRGARASPTKNMTAKKRR